MSNEQNTYGVRDPSGVVIEVGPTAGEVIAHVCKQHGMAWFDLHNLGYRVVNYPVAHAEQ
jgi:hypothetical protein